MNHKFRSLSGAAPDLAPRLLTSAAALFGIASLTFAGTAARAQTTYLNDTFDDDSYRTTQALPSKAHWYIGGAGGTNAPGTGAVASAAYNVGLGGSVANPDAAGSVETTTAYFTAAASPVSLTSVGDSITLSFDISGNYGSNASVVAAGTTAGFTGGGSFGNDMFRFGLYNSNSTTASGATDYQVTSDQTGSNGTNSAYTHYTGYGLFTALGNNNGNNPGNERLLVRNNPTGSSLVQSVAANNAFGSTAAAPVTLSGFSYTNNFLTITKSLTGVTVSGSFGGVTIAPQTDTTASNYTSFDSVVFLGQQGVFGNSGASYTLDNVKVAVTTASAPEPGALALLLPGLLAGGSSLLHRRRRRA